MTTLIRKFILDDDFSHVTVNLGIYVERRHIEGYGTVRWIPLDEYRISIEKKNPGYEGRDLNDQITLYGDKTFVDRVTSLTNKYDDFHTVRENLREWGIGC